MRTYNIIYNVIGTATLSVKANSEAEARELADPTDADLDDWETTDVESVEDLGEEEDDE